MREFDKNRVTLKIDVDAKRLRPFLRLLESGVSLRVPEGISVKKALVAFFGIDPDYLEHRVQTLFLNGRPVDDMDAAVVAEGSVLSLSAAMPGLVGATLRRRGLYAVMRQRLEGGGPSPETGKTARVTVKLFNLVARELGPRLFKDGIVIDASTFQAFLKDAAQSLSKDDFSIQLNGRPVLLSELGRGGVAAWTGDQ